MLPRACSNLASGGPDALTGKQKAQLLADIDEGVFDVEEALWAYIQADRGTGFLEKRSQAVRHEPARSRSTGTASSSIIAFSGVLRSRSCFSRTLPDLEQ